MDYAYRYRDVKYEVGRRLLGLRTRAKLTQTALAKLLGVSIRTIQNWEAGENYPKEEHLRALIEIYLRLSVLYPGQEHEEALTLWEQVSQDAPQKLGAFDEIWFKNMLHQLVASYPDNPTNPLSQQSQTPSSQKALKGSSRKLYHWDRGYCRRASLQSSLQAS